MLGFFSLFRADDSDVFRSSFLYELSGRANRFLSSLALVAAFLFPVFGVLDHVLFPEVAWSLNLVRIGVLPIIAGTFFFTLWKKAPVYVVIAGTILYQSMGLAIDLMVYQTGGIESRYYSGVQLVLLAMYLYMPWKPLISILNGIGIYAVYAVVAVVGSPGPVDINLFVSNSYFLLATVFIGSVGSIVSFRLIVQESRGRHQLQKEKETSDRLLLNILPGTIARELESTGRVSPVLYNEISVMFTDFMDFTRISALMSPRELIDELDAAFRQFDEIVAAQKLEKLKTIGDSYMCAGGIPESNRTHAIDCALAGFQMIAHNDRLRKERSDAGKEHWGIRVGVHTGPVVAGVTGARKFAYDIWGDTVNTASRMESSSEANQINASAAAYRHIRHFFDCTARGRLPTKGKGDLMMYSVVGIKAELSDELGRPNREFMRRYRAYSVYGR